MKKKYLTLALLPLLLVACGGGSSSESTSSIDADYQHLYDAATLKSNDKFTGYRLMATLRNDVERVYSLQKYVYIDREQNYYHVEQTETKISPSADNILAEETTKTDVYYDQGSKYELQADNSYKQTDGTVSQSSLMFKFNPKKEYFLDMDFKVNVNVYTLSATIDPAHANSLFESTGLENIVDATLKVNVHDDILDDISYKYTLNGIKTEISILMFYSAQNITLPIVRD